MARNSRSSHVSYDRVLQRSVDPRTAFDIGYQQATDGQGDGSDSVRHVKNNYEQRLANYLKQLPDDPDFSGVPAQFRNNLSNYLSNAKSEYVASANAIDDMVVGSDDYMDTMAKMNGIKSSFENLDGQFKLYNATKKTVIDDIEGQRISMYGENQANANLLRGIFNEEYELEIDETGNLYFVGDDGKIGLNDLPDYGMKDFATADKMVTMGVNVYKNGAQNGYALKRDDVMYHQYSNKLKRMIYNGGKNTLMSVLYDGLVGDIAMADDPAMKELINGYENGAVGFDELTKATVDSYMKTLIQQSQNGTKQTKVTPAKGTGAPSTRQKSIMKRLMDNQGKVVDTNFISRILAGTSLSIVGPTGDGEYLIYDRRESSPTNINADYTLKDLSLNETDGILPIIKDLIESGVIK